jgi:hypothetical protein
MPAPTVPANQPIEPNKIIPASVSLLLFQVVVSYDLAMSAPAYMPVATPAASLIPKSERP